MQERKEEARMKEDALREEVERTARRLEEERQKVLAAQVRTTHINDSSPTSVSHNTPLPYVFSPSLPSTVTGTRDVTEAA